jgi:hypothetical protein
MAPALSLLLVTLLFAVAPAPSLATKIDVGGKQRWAPNVNYTTWANQQQFYQCVSFSPRSLPSIYIWVRSVNPAHNRIEQF